MLDVTSVLRPERAELLRFLEGLTPEQWALPTECPAYSVKGVATHLLGDDVSLLSRQRDAAENGLVQLAVTMPGADFRTLLDAFNDRWVVAASFLSPAVVVELLRVVGAWTADYYEAVDLLAPGEPVGFFGGGGPDGTSPFWQAIAREYVERWAHHSQLRRAVGLGSLATEPFLRTGADVIAAALGVEAVESGGEWRMGDAVLGDAQQAADLLTRRYTKDEAAELVGDGFLALLLGRPE